jgi:hypothetical protein
MRYGYMRLVITLLDFLISMRFRLRIVSYLTPRVRLYLKCLCSVGSLCHWITARSDGVLF